jgi:hypothetical protein
MAGRLEGSSKVSPKNNNKKKEALVVEKHGFWFTFSLLFPNRVTSNLVVSVRELKLVAKKMRIWVHIEKGFPLKKLTSASKW